MQRHIVLEFQSSGLLHIHTTTADNADIVSTRKLIPQSTAPRPEHPSNAMFRAALTHRLHTDTTFYLDTTVTHNREDLCADGGPLWHHIRKHNIRNNIRHQMKFMAATHKQLLAIATGMTNLRSPINVLQALENPCVQCGIYIVDEASQETAACYHADALRISNARTSAHKRELDDEVDLNQNFGSAPRALECCDELQLPPAPTPTALFADPDGTSPGQRWQCTGCDSSWKNWRCYTCENQSKKP